MSDVIQRGRWREQGWYVGAVIGIMVGIGAGAMTQTWQEQRQTAQVAEAQAALDRVEVVPPPGETVRALLAQESSVVVDPLLADRVSASDLAQVETILAADGVQTRIAYVHHPDRHDGFTESGLARQWSTGVGEVGHYVVLFDDGYKEFDALGLADDYVLTDVEGQPGPALIRLAEDVSMWKENLPPTAPDAPRDSAWGGTFRGLVTAVCVNMLVVVPLFLLLRSIVSVRLSRRNP